jgi:hypothetical protein
MFAFVSYADVLSKATKTVVRTLHVWRWGKKDIAGCQHENAR